MTKLFSAAKAKYAKTQIINKLREAATKIKEEAVGIENAPISFSEEETMFQLHALLLWLEVAAKTVNMDAIVEMMSIKAVMEGKDPTASLKAVEFIKEVQEGIKYATPLLHGVIENTSGRRKIAAEYVRAIGVITNQLGNLLEDSEYLEYTIKDLFNKSSIIVEGRKVARIRYCMERNTDIPKDFQIVPEEYEFQGETLKKIIDSLSKESIDMLQEDLWHNEYDCPISSYIRSIKAK